MVQRPGPHKMAKRSQIFLDKNLLFLQGSANILDVCNPSKHLRSIEDGRNKMLLKVSLDEVGRLDSLCYFGIAVYYQASEASSPNKLNGW